MPKLIQPSVQFKTVTKINKKFKITFCSSLNQTKVSQLIAEITFLNMKKIIILFCFLSFFAEINTFLLPKITYKVSTPKGFHVSFAGDILSIVQMLKLLIQNLNF
jgi:hypothetical protein